MSEGEDVNIRELLNTSDDEEEFTSAEIIEQMQEAWVNEKFAPEILPNKMELVECLLAQINYFEENREELNNDQLQKNLRQLEVDRLRFIVSSYLRTRLEKIETYAFSILKEDEARHERGEATYLTENELEFALNYRQSIEKQMEGILSRCPAVHSTDWKTDAITPNMSSFVFLKSKANLQGVLVGDPDDEDSGEVDFKNNTQALISYTAVSNLLKESLIKLI